MNAKQKTAVLILTSIFGLITKVQGQIQSMPDHIMITPEVIKWGNANPAIPPGAEAAVLEGNPSLAGPYTIRLKLPANWIIKPHVHPDDEHITVVEGSCYMGLGDKQDEKTAIALPIGSYAVMNKGTVHYLYTKKPCTVQVHGMGPWGITYINPGDDPRNKK